MYVDGEDVDTGLVLHLDLQTVQMYGGADEADRNQDQVQAIHHHRHHLLHLRCRLG